MRSAYCCTCVLHGSDKCHRLRGAGAHGLRPTVPEHAGHWRLVGQTEHSLILSEQREECDEMAVDGTDGERPRQQRMLWAVPWTVPAAGRAG